MIGPGQKENSVFSLQLSDLTRPMYAFQPLDCFLAAVYLLLFLWGALWISRSFTTPARMHFLVGFGAKVLGCITFLSLYLFYFEEGDTFHYYQGVDRIWQAMLEDPANAFHLFWLKSGQHTLALSDITLDIAYFNASAEWVFIRLASLVNLVCFNNFLCLSLVFSVLAFWGTWSIYRVFAALYPQSTNGFFLAILLVPSCLIWTSGLLKDSLCLGLIGFIFRAGYQLSQGNFRKAQMAVPLVCLYLLFLVKSYLATTLFLALTIWLYLRFIRRSDNEMWKRLLPLPLILILFLSVINISSLLEGLEEQHVFQTSMEKIRGYHNEYGSDEDNSQYTLGEVNYTLSGIARKAPEALITTLLRPYIWESGKVLLVLMSIENMVYLLVTIWIVAKYRFWAHPFRYLYNEELIFCAGFVLSLGLVVGLTAYNFGLLARLKAPLLPFLGAGLVVLKERLADEVKPMVVLR